MAASRPLPRSRGPSSLGEGPRESRPACPRRTPLLQGTQAYGRASSWSAARFLFACS